MPVPQIIIDKVNLFERDFDVFKSPDYKEGPLREEFINPFFEALRWDVSNIAGNALQHKDVIHEDSIKTVDGTKSPDYCFTAGGTRKFFVEAKKPHINIRTNTDAQFQLKRYAWSEKLPIAILTNFEYFDVYEARKPPKKTDKPLSGRVLCFSYNQYEEKWDEIDSLFSKNAVFQGLFDKFAESKMKKKGTIEVDTEFLKEIEGWRKALAGNIALRNLNLSTSEMNYSVQSTIDRIIFLRMCEGRGIESYGQLQSLLKSDNVYGGLCGLYKEADEKYNSGLFHFQKEKDRGTPPDELTLTLTIDDEVLKDIIKNLYYPDSPYQFSAISPEILGNVYEQFLGKVIRLTPSHRAKVEEKPEVKKAGGVYYTPLYIVDHIVENTVGKLCKGKTPNQISKLRILDPACGSGSFLLRAYKYLLNYHLDYYSKSKNPERYKKKIYKGMRDNWHLTIEEKKRILLNNVYGVDIDDQAVEVTKLSLLLKVLEGENKDVLKRQRKIVKERALPDLGKNIQCGNSLISSDFVKSHQTTLPDIDDEYGMKAFEWKKRFPQIMRNKGFDIVIGNPPYARIQTLIEHKPTHAKELKKKYISAQSGNFDIYVVFIERGLQLLNPKGILGYICPHKFFNAKYGKPLRNLLIEGKHLSKIIHFGDQQIFKGATTYTCLLFLDKRNKYKFEFDKVDDINQWKLNEKCTTGKINLKEVTDEEWNFVIGPSKSLFDRLKAMPVKFGDIAHIFVGLQTSADRIYLFKDYRKINTKITKVYSKELNKYIELESDLLKSVVRNNGIGRFWAKSTALILFPYRVADGKYQLISEEELKSTFPKTWDYLHTNKILLSKRERGKFKGHGWYQLYPKNIDAWEQPKLMLPYMITRLSCYYDENNLYFVNVTTGGFGATVDEQYGSSEYIMGLMNSKLLDWYLRQVSTTFHGGYFAANKQFIKQLPIKTIDFSNEKDKTVHDEIINLVKNMNELHNRLFEAKTPTEKEEIQHHIENTDQQIDNLVYELYSLTENEIKIIEGIEI